MRVLLSVLVIMENSGGRDARFNIAYNMNILSGETSPDIYSSNPMNRIPSTSLQQISPRHSTMVTSICGSQNPRGNNTGLKSNTPDVCYDDRGLSQSQGLSIEQCGVSEIDQDTYTSMQPKKSPPSNGKKTKGRVKIKMEYIENKLRRYTTFSKRKTGIMKKAYELSTLTGTQVMLLVASETGHVYTFATRKLQPMITSEAGKALIQTCLNSPDPAGGTPGPSGSDQRMSATGFEETELTYNISDEDTKDEDSSPGCGDSSDSGSGADSPGPPTNNTENKKHFDFPTVSTTSNSTTNNITTSSPLSGALPPGITVYQTPGGAMYAAPTGSGEESRVPTGAGVILSLQNGPPGAPPQFITIPLMGPAPTTASSTATSSQNSSTITSSAPSVTTKTLNTITLNSTTNQQEIDLSIKTERNL